MVKNYLICDVVECMNLCMYAFKSVCPLGKLHVCVLVGLSVHVYERERDVGCGGEYYITQSDI